MICPACLVNHKLMLMQFLERDPARRLGCKPIGDGMAMEEIKRHPWFSTIDWVKLEAKELEPPFVPDVLDSMTIPFVLLTSVPTVEESKLRRYTRA